MTYNKNQLAMVGRRGRKGKAVFTPDEVVEIRVRRLYGDSVKRLSEEYGVSAGCITQLCTGNTYTTYKGPVVPPLFDKLSDSEKAMMRSEWRAYVDMYENSKEEDE
jgi:hypothetical protein